MNQRALELYAAGMPMKAIARELGCSLTSVKRWVIPGYADRKRLRDLRTSLERSAAFRRRLEADLRSITCKDI
jgi:uncharacterized protein YjcR